MDGPFRSLVGSKTRIICDPRDSRILGFKVASCNGQFFWNRAFSLSRLFEVATPKTPTNRVSRADPLHILGVLEHDLRQRRTDHPLTRTPSGPSSNAIVWVIPTTPYFDAA